MRNSNKVSWARMVLASAAVLIVAGSGLALAAGPAPTYVPQSSVILGPSTVAPSSVTQYTFEVTFINGVVADFPPTTGATFTAQPASASTTSSFVVTAPPVGPILKINATFIQNGFTTSASRFIAVQ